MFKSAGGPDPLLPPRYNTCMHGSDSVVADFLTGGVLGLETYIHTSTGSRNEERAECADYGKGGTT